MRERLRMRERERGDINSQREETEKHERESREIDIQ